MVVLLSSFRQNGLILIPDPRGEKGLTFAHMKASLRDSAEKPSSKKNTGPYATTPSSPTISSIQYSAIVYNADSQCLIN